MSGKGIWSDTEKPILPGAYNIMEALAKARIERGQKGVFAVPVTGNWGPVRKLTEVEWDKDLIDLFGSDMNYDAYKLGRLALLGQPRILYLYRMTDGSEKQGLLVLKGEEDKEIITLLTKYPSNREFQVTVAPSVSEENHYNISVYEDSRELITFYNVGGTPAEMVEYINKYDGNIYIEAASNNKEETIAKLNSIVGEKITGGNNGIDNLTMVDFINTLSDIELDSSINALSTGSVTGDAYMTSLISWIDRNNKEGNKLLLYTGVPDNYSLDETITFAKQTNNKHVQVNYSSHEMDGVSYSRAESAVYFGAFDTGLDQRKSAGNKVTPFDDVNEKLKKTDKEKLYKSGVFYTELDEDKVVKTVDDLNTLTKYGQNENEIFSNMRFMKFANGLEEDLQRALNKDYVSEVLQEENDIETTLGAISKYFEIFVQANIIKPDYEIYVDEARQKNAKKNELFYAYEFEYVDVIKRFYGRGIAK